MNHEHNWQYVTDQVIWKTVIVKKKEHWWQVEDKTEIEFDGRDLKFACECGATKWVRENITEDSRPIEEDDD